MLATLYARALDSESDRSILHDDAARSAVSRIDYDFGKTGIRSTSAAGVAVRAKYLDDWTTEFLAAHPEATVLHLACGLDTRVQRLKPAASVRWLDVDYPDIISLRERLLPAPQGDYRMVAASVTDDGWLEEVPADRPTVAVFEGLTMYLTEADGKRLIQRITDRFSSGQLLFDCYGTVGIKLQKMVPAVRRSGATLHWGIDDPYALESLHPGMTCLDAIPSMKAGIDRMPALARMQLGLLGAIPALRKTGQIMRFRY
ncbi:class I SAM-dependent methyltransferase [Fodinicola acaciae]|uniref:class I SAM-dependent methyltransferase n=1 Tax=Fodinicola acaciae TaxID=2681555 RepID=UPI0013D67457|nr:class I SAM-dependent methyltransferase [Fodinicola acaciae]